MISSILRTCFVVYISFGTTHDKTNEMETFDVVNNYHNISLLPYDNLPSYNHYQDSHSLVVTFNFIKGQKFSLDFLKTQFPDLNSDLMDAENKFNKAFGKAVVKIKDRVEQELDEGYQPYEDKLKSQFNIHMSNQQIDKKVARDFINSVKERAKGKLETPVLETLVHLQFEENPSKEVASGFSKEFKIQEQNTNSVMNMSYKMPLSWKKTDMDRPNVSAQFISQNGTGNERLNIVVDDFKSTTRTLLAENEIAIEFITDKRLKEMVPKNAQFTSSKIFLVDNKRAGMNIYKENRNSNDGLNKILQSCNLMLIHKGQMIVFNLGVTSDSEWESKTKAELFIPLFEEIIKTISLN